MRRAFALVACARAPAAVASAYAVSLTGPRVVDYGAPRPVSRPARRHMRVHRLVSAREIASGFVPRSIGRRLDAEVPYGDAITIRS